jgi:hypothetical protein
VRAKIKQLQAHIQALGATTARPEIGRRWRSTVNSHRQQIPVSVYRLVREEIIRFSAENLMRREVDSLGDRPIKRLDSLEWRTWASAHPSCGKDTNDVI